MTAPGKPGSPDWQRKVTASKVAAILGVSPWESPRSLWHKMRGDIPPEPSTSVQRRGTHLEAGLLNWYFEDRPHLTRAGGETWVSRPDLPWAGGYPDDIATDPTTGETWPVDAKTDGRGTFGRPGTDEVPVYYYTQALWVMHLGGYSRFEFVVLGPYLERAEYMVTYDAALAAEVEVLCREFHESLTGDVPPNLDGSVATYDAIRATVPAGDGDWECPPALARELCYAREAVAAADERHNLARSRLLEAMGDARRAVCGGQVIGQKQKTKGGVALHPPRRPVDTTTLPTGTPEDPA